MELPCRNRGDELLRPGELVDIRRRLRKLAGKGDLTTVIACAFDHRTRMLPFFFADTRMAPAGVRALAAALLDSGFSKTRIVLQQWNKNFRPAHMRLDGDLPDLFLVSSLQLHLKQCQALIRDACRIEPSHRPLIVAGGPNIIYNPWDAFSTDRQDPWAADVAVTGEEYVLLNLLEVLLSLRGANESLRTTFLHARDGGLLEQIPGLVYARYDGDAIPEELIDTGIQRLVGDLDELPDPVLGYQTLEPPSKKSTLAPRALEADRVRKCNPIGSLVVTFGCRFACGYCPIPAYNQRHYRCKSGNRVRDEITQLNRKYGMRYFFATDDNFFNDKQRTFEIVDTIARAQINGRAIRHEIRWGTEVTVHDTLRMKEHLLLVRAAGVRALWLGVEDMTATLIKKGQSVEKTTEAFRLLHRHGIAPMPMMMHHDTQPLYTRGSPYGLLNQVRLLRKAGAASLQVLMISPATGSKMLEETYTSGQVYQSAAGREVEPRMFDGNYVVASGRPQPWRKQLNLMAAYLYFYNPLRFLSALVRPKSRLYFADAAFQLVGMAGLAHTIRRTLGWTVRLMHGNIKFKNKAPASEIPMRSPNGTPACHAVNDSPQRQCDLGTNLTRQGAKIK